MYLKKKVCILALILFFTTSLFALPNDYYQKRSNWNYHYRCIKTTHFNILFEPQDYDSALEVKSFCEDVYTDITTLFESYPKKIDVVLHGRIDIANGFYHPLPEMLHLYIASPPDQFHGAKTESWLKLLFTHEFTHYVHISYQKGWLYSLSKIFGPSVKTVPGGFLPGYLLEGYTTNTETIFTQGGRGKNPFFELIYKSHILEGNLFSLEKATYNFSEPPSGRIYVGGYIFVDYLIRHYGIAVLKQIHDQVVKNPFNPHKAIEIVTGKTTNELYDNMRLELIDKYKNDMLLPHRPIVSPYKKAHYHLPLKNDMGIITYIEDSKQPHNLSYYDINLKRFTKIVDVSLVDFNSYTCTQKGEKIYFASYDINARAPKEASYTSDIFFVDLSNSKKNRNKTRYLNVSIKRLTKNKHLYHPVVSYDGTKLVAVQRNKSYSSLVEVDKTSGETKILVEIPEACIYSPALSGDGSQIAFIVNIKGQQDLWLYKDGKTTILLSDSKSSQYYPRFLDDTTLLFTSDKNNSLALYSYNLTEKKIKLELTDRVGVVSAISYNDQWLYSSYRSNGYSLLVAEKGNSLQESNPFNNYQGDTKEISNNENNQLILTSDDLTRYNYQPPLQKEEDTTSFYANVAKFLGWTPIPFYYTKNKTNLAPWGIGFGLWAKSVDSKSFLQFILTNPFTIFQPSLFIDAKFPIGVLDVSYSYQQQYGSYSKSINDNLEEIYYQRIFQNLSINIPFYYHIISNRTVAFLATVGLAHEYLIQKNGPFHLFEASKNEFSGFQTSNKLIQYDGLTFYYGKSSASDAIYPSSQIRSSFGIQLQIPLLANSEVGIIGYLENSFSIPVAPHHNIFGELNLAYSNIKNISFNISPRGYESEISSYKGKGTATLGYNYQLSSLDLPIVSNLSFQGLAFALFLQTQFWYDFSLLNAKADNYIYAGIEFKPLVGWSTATFPITVGINCRFDLSFQNGFNPKTDIAPYFAFDYSFITNYKNKRASWIAQNETKPYKIN